MAKVLKLHDDSNATGDRVIVPAAAVGDSLVTLAATQTLTNKTLTSPTLTTPDIGVATATSVNKLTITAPATAATLTIIDGTTLTGPAATDTLVGRTSTDTLTNKTLTTPVHTLSVQVLAAAGSGQGDAGAVTATSGALVHATGADGTKGIVLPAAAAGGYYYVKNADAANAILKVYPASGDAINALSGNAAISMAAKTAAVFVAVDGTTWFTFSLLPS